LVAALLGLGQKGVRAGLSHHALQPIRADEEVAVGDLVEGLCVGLEVQIHPQAAAAFLQ
jgi:hypothetical protein